MNFRTTILLAILAIGAAVAVVLLQRQEPTRDEIKPVSEKVFASVDSDGVTRIEIARRAAGDRLVLERRGTSWMLTSPVQARADWTQVTELATMLATMTFGSEKDLSDDNRRKFGLEPAEATITFTCGDTTYQCSVGDETAFGDKYTYVTTPGRKAILLAKVGLLTVANAKLTEWRDKKLVTFTAEEVHAVTLTRGGTATRAERSGRGWLLTTPVRARGDAEAVNTLIGAVTGLQASAFEPGEPADLTRYGLAEPRLVVELARTMAPEPKAETKDAAKDAAAKAPAAEAKGPDTLTIKVGGYADLGKTTAYVQVSDSPTVVTVEESKIAAFNAADSGLRDKHAVAFGDGNASYVSIDLDGEAVAVERVVGDKWQILAPLAAPGDAVAVGAMIDRLRNLKVKEFDDNAERTDVRYGFDKPYGTITFRLDSDERDLTVIIGKSPETGQFWALESGTTAAGRIEAADVAALKTSYLDLHTRTVWEVPAGGMISEVSWTRHGETVTVKRSKGPAGDVYSMTAPVAQELDAEKAAKLFSSFMTLSAEKFLAASGSAKEYGLDAPELIITVTAQAEKGGADGATQRMLRVARKDNRHVALLDGGDLIFEISKDLAAQFSKPMSKEVWGAFDTNAVHLLEIKGPGLDLELSRSGDQWSATNVQGFVTDSMRVRWYLGDLSSAEASQVVAYAAKDLAEYGLDQSEWRVRVKGLSVDKVFLISVKGPIEGGRYATIESSGRIVVLDAKDLANLTKDKSYFSTAK